MIYLITSPHIFTGTYTTLEVTAPTNWNASIIYRSYNTQHLSHLFFGRVFFSNTFLTNAPPVSCRHSNIFTWKPHTNDKWNMLYLLANLKLLFYSCAINIKNDILAQLNFWFVMLSQPRSRSWQTFALLEKCINSFTFRLATRWLKL